MSQRFHQGQKLACIYFNNETSFMVGRRNCTHIEVIMENGQMGMVPWALAYTGEHVHKVNLAQVESVVLAQEIGDE